VRVYATEEGTGKRVLVALVCDECEARIKPSPDISKSGWEKRGTYYGPGNERNTEWLLCPGCVATHGLGGA
jgi:hypothetical protein